MASFIKVLRPGVYTIAVRAKPGSKVTNFASVANSSDEALEIRLAAPPVEGQANKELVDFMQETLETGMKELGGFPFSPEKLFAHPSHTASKPTFTDLPVTGDDAAKKGTSGSSKKTKGRGTKKSKCRAEIGDLKDKSGTTNTSENVFLPPTRVAVRLARGTTSRSKLLEVEFPGSEWELACLLEKVSD